MSSRELTNQELGIRVSWVTVVINILLSIGKLFAGLFANSSAMVSDAVESGGDVVSTLIVMLGMKMSHKEADSCHRYGHERLESVTALFLAMILGFTALGIGYSGIEKIKLAMEGNLLMPGALALVAALVTIGVKEWMYWYTKAAAKKTNSSALLANAWHHRSDAISSIVTLVGIGGAMLGFPVLDPITSLVICIFILKIAYDIGSDALCTLTDKAIDEKIVLEIETVIRAQEGVLAIDDIKTRKFANKFYVDVEIAVDGCLQTQVAHAIAERVHDEIESSFPDAKHVMVHINPYQAS